MTAIEEPTFYLKMWGLWVTAETISKNMGSLGDSSTENRGSFEPYICITSIMGVPPRPGTCFITLSTVNHALGDCSLSSSKTL